MVAYKYLHGSSCCLWQRLFSSISTSSSSRAVNGISPSSANIRLTIFPRLNWAKIPLNQRLLNKELKKLLKSSQQKRDAHLNIFEKVSTKMTKLKMNTTSPLDSTFGKMVQLSRCAITLGQDRSRKSPIEKL